MIKIAVGGAFGRMGQRIIGLVGADPTLKLVAELTRPKGSVGGLQSLTQPIDVFIDFTSKDALLQHLDIAAERHYRMVIGVTGLDPNQKQALLRTAEKIPIVYSPNMSIAANITFKVLEYTADLMKEYAEIAITDIHHRHKKDAPSGTALAMASSIQKGLGLDHKQEIQFASLRLGEVMGEHMALFALAGEQLEIKHQANDRSIFALGAIKAAKWIMDKPPGLYDMQDVLGLKEQKRNV